MAVDAGVGASSLPAFCQARVLILGVGNILFGDDGFGPSVASMLACRYEIPDDIYVMDVGTGVRRILFTLTLGQELPDEIVVVDAVDWGNSVGEVTEISVEALPTTKMDDFSLHHAPTSNLLRDLQKKNGVKVSVVACDVGVVPQMIKPGLSDSTHSAVQEACDKIAARFHLGHYETVLEKQRARQLLECESQIRSLLVE